MLNVANTLARQSVKTAGFILLMFYAFALAADFISPYHFANEERRLSYASPTPIHFFHEGHLQWPFVYGIIDGFDQYHRRTFTADTSKRYPIKFFSQGKLMTVDNPGRLYLLGADSRGRDMLSRLIYGARVSLTIGLIGALVAFCIGLIVGAVAGYFGGWIDSVLMRLCEVFMLAPAFYLMLALRSAVPTNFNSVQVYLMVIIILSLIGWASLARIIRGMSLSLRKRSYVDTAKLLGLSNWQIILKHILPHTASYALVAVSLTIPSYILAEAGLSLLGLGIQDPVPSWGNMLADSMTIVVIQFAPWLLWPGIIILITVICFNHLGEAFRDALDPLYHDKKS